MCVGVLPLRDLQMSGVQFRRFLGGQGATSIVLPNDKVANGDYVTAFRSLKKFSFASIDKVFRKATANAVRIEQDKVFVAFNNCVDVMYACVEKSTLEKNTPRPSIRSKGNI